MKNTTNTPLTSAVLLMTSLLNNAKRKAIQEWNDFMTYRYGSPF